jgi:hypothetical protein
MQRAKETHVCVFVCVMRVCVVRVCAARACVSSCVDAGVRAGVRGHARALPAAPYFCCVWTGSIYGCAREEAKASSYSPPSAPDSEEEDTGSSQKQPTGNLRRLV